MAILLPALLASEEDDKSYICEEQEVMLRPTWHFKVMGVDFISIGAVSLCVLLQERRSSFGIVRNR